MLETKIPLLREILEDAEANPDSYDLASWAKVEVCGTTVCIGGSAAIRSGHRIDWVDFDSRGCCCYTVDGEYIEDVARRELGLTEREAYDLFFCVNLDEVWRVAERISGGQITREGSYATVSA